MNIFSVLLFTFYFILKVLSEPFPASIGIVGVGTIGSALARGILSSPPGHISQMPRFVLSPRNAEKSAALKKDFPDFVTIAKDDQGVVDAAQCVVLALPGSVAVSVIQPLKFTPTHHVISLIAAVNYTQLQQLLGSEVDCTIATPFPAIAKRAGATIGFPSKSYAKAIFSVLGTYLAASSEAEMRLMGITGTWMGDFYKRQLTIQQWMVDKGIAPEKAAPYIGAVFASIAADSMDAGPSTFAEKVQEQTPGGLNEMVWKEQEAAGVYIAVNKSLDAVYNRHTLQSSFEVNPDSL